MDITLHNLVAGITKKKDEIKTALDVVAVTAATVGAVLVDAVTAQKSGVDSALTTTATTVQLESLTSTVNTTGKHIGKQVFNSTSKVVVSAGGTAALSTWHNAGTGAVAHTPI